MGHACGKGSRRNSQRYCFKNEIYPASSTVPFVAPLAIQIISSIRLNIFSEKMPPAALSMNSNSVICTYMLLVYWIYISE
jgi:hypothetical protein